MLTSIIMTTYWGENWLISILTLCFCHSATSPATLAGAHLSTLLSLPPTLCCYALIWIWWPHPNLTYKISCEISSCPSSHEFMSLLKILLHSWMNRQPHSCLCIDLYPLMPFTFFSLFLHSFSMILGSFCDSSGQFGRPLHDPWHQPHFGFGRAICDAWLPSRSKLYSNLNLKRC